MTNLNKNSISDYIEQKEEKEKVQKSVKRFDFRPFYKKYSGLKNVAKILTLVLPALSVFTGSLWLGSIFQTMLSNFWISVVFGFAIVVLLEYAKNYLLNLGFTDFYAKIKFSYILISFGLLLGSVSAYISLQGIKNLHKEADTSLKDLELSQTLQTDSLKNYFDAKLAAAKKDLADFKSSISWNGKINMNNSANAKILQDFSNSIQTIQKEKTKALNALETQNTKQFNSLQVANGFNLQAILIIVISIEVLILLAGWFLVFFDAKVKKQSETLAGSLTEINVSSSDFAEMIKMFWLNSQEAFLIPANIQTNQSQVLGFQAGQNEKQDLQDLNKTYEKNASDLKKTKNLSLNKTYKELIAEIKAGQRHRPTLAKKYKVNIKMINQLIKEYGN